MTLITKDNELEQNQLQAESQLEGFARMGLLLEFQRTRDTEFDYLLDRHIEERREYEEGSALSLEVQRTVRIVLCTGGPHCEIRWPEDSNPSIVCYGWFGAGKFERELTKREVAGIEYIYGEWDDLARIDEEQRSRW